ncbi:MAG: hypothetical protein QW343_02545 [Candidatus Norongarragalinales archaeon]
MSFNQQAVLEYVLQRQNSDGGFAFVPKYYGWEFPTSVLDSYYCLSILSALEKKTPHEDKLRTYVRTVFEKESCQTAVLDFYLHEIAVMSGITLEFSERHAKKWLEILRRTPSPEELVDCGASDGYSTSDSPLQNFFAAAFLLKKFGFETPKLRWNENVFSRLGDITSVAYAVAISKLFGLKANYADAVNFIQSCNGKNGFSACPNAVTPFIESRYFGCFALIFLGKKLLSRALSSLKNYRTRTADFAERCLAEFLRLNLLFSQLNCLQA